MDTAEVLTRERQTTIDAAEAALLRAHSLPLRICRPKRSPPATRDAVRLLARSSRPSQLGPDRRLRPTSGARTLQCGLRPFGGPDGVQCPGGGDMELHLHCIAAAAVCRSPGAGQHDSRSRQRRARAGIRIACDEQTCAFARPTSPICWPGGSCATRMTTAATDSSGRRSQCIRGCHRKAVGRASARLRSSASLIGYGQQRDLSVEVDVAVHAAEQALLRASSTARAENDQVVTSALELLQDLGSRVSSPLHPVRRDICGYGSGCLRRAGSSPTLSSSALMVSMLTPPSVT